MHKKKTLKLFSIFQFSESWLSFITVPYNIAICSIFSYVYDFLNVSLFDIFLANEQNPAYVHIGIQLFEEKNFLASFIFRWNRSLAYFSNNFFIFSKQIFRWKIHQILYMRNFKTK